MKRAHVNIRKDKAHQNKSKNDSEKHANMRCGFLEIWKLTEYGDHCRMNLSKE